MHPGAHIGAAPPSVGPVSAIPDTTSNYQLSRLPADQGAIVAQPTEQTKLEESPEGAGLITNSVNAEAAREPNSAVPPIAAEESIVPAAPSVSALPSFRGSTSGSAPSQPPEENNGIDAPKSEQAGLWGDLPESTEPAHEFRTASATDNFDYTGPPSAAGEANVGVTLPSSPALSATSDALRPELLLPEQKASTSAPRTEQAKLEESAAAAPENPSNSIPPKHSYLAYYVYDEHPPPRRPADIVLDCRGMFQSARHSRKSSGRPMPSG